MTQITLPVSVTNGYAKSLLGAMLERIAVRRMLMRGVGPSEMYFRQSSNRMEELGRFWLYEMVHNHRIKTLKIARHLGSELLGKVQSSFPRFKTANQTLDDELNVLEAAERITELHPEESGFLLHRRHRVFGPCGLLRNCREPWYRLQQAAEQTLQVVGHVERKRIVSLLWHANQINKEGCMPPEEQERLVEQACALCREAAEEAMHLRKTNAHDSIAAIQAIIRQDVT